MPFLCPKIRLFRKKGKPTPPDQSLRGVFMGHRRAASGSGTAAVEVRRRDGRAIRSQELRAILCPGRVDRRYMQAINETRFDTG